MTQSKLHDPNKVNIELDITLACNGKCLNCVRHCNMEDLGVDNSGLEMSVEQVADFAEQVRKHRSVEAVKIMGGEPLVHPKVDEIAELLRSSLLDAGYVDDLWIVSNMLVKRDSVAGVRVTNYLPYGVKPKWHRCTLVAPIDTGQKFRYPCAIPFDCGFGYDATGCYPCACAPSICRLFDLQQYRRTTIPRSLAEFGNLHELCKLCQAAVPQEQQLREPQFGRMVSISYRKRFEELARSKKAP